MPDHSNEKLRRSRLFHNVNARFRYCPATEVTSDRFGVIVGTFGEAKSQRTVKESQCSHRRNRTAGPATITFISRQSRQAECRRFDGKVSLRRSFACRELCENRLCHDLSPGRVTHQCKRKASSATVRHIGAAVASISTTLALPSRVYTSLAVAMSRIRSSAYESAANQTSGSRKVSAECRVCTRQSSAVHRAIMMPVIVHLGSQVDQRVFIYSAQRLQKPPCLRPCRVLFVPIQEVILPENGIFNL